MRGQRLATCKGGALGTVMLALTLSASSAWGYFFDERREMSLSGFAYSRATFALSDDSIGAGKGMYQTGNLVQHRNFLTLEWRHNINRVTRDMPTIGPLAQFLNLDGFDYYLNLREAYDGVWDYGPKGIRRQRDGGVGGFLPGETRINPPGTGGSGPLNYWDKYFGRVPPSPAAFPSRWSSRDRNFAYLTNMHFLEKQINQISLFEWYFNISKGPLFIRIGRQNLSWGETDSFRLLDQINPLDNAFGGFLVPLDERRVPLNMLRAQWSFGTVGPVSDLTLEAFVSPDRRTSAYYGLTPSFWTPYTVTSPVMVGRMPCGGPFYGRRNPGPSDQPGNGEPCSFRAQGPHSDLASSRGGVRLVGTINDFTFSLAHYYTWQDGPVSAAAMISPTPAHLAWDTNAALFGRLTGKDPFERDSSGRFVNNPWGSNDQVVGRDAAGKPAVGGPGATTAVPAVQERNTGVPIREKRIQITGASLSFPVNALTGMFVGSDNPLYYIYTTFRGEVAYFRNVGFRSNIHDASTVFNDQVFNQQRFMTLPLARAGITEHATTPLAGNGSSLYDPTFLPGGSFSSEGNCTDTSVRGCRIGRFKSRDVWAFSIGLDHNQWIRWLNPNNTFTISGQIFVNHVMNNRNTYDLGKPIGGSNDVFGGGLQDRSGNTIGPGRTDPRLLDPNIRPGGLGNRSFSCAHNGQTAGQLVTPQFAPCNYKRLLPLKDTNFINTLAISTQYLGGNLRPSMAFVFDWNGSWLLQPGVDWTFYDPFRVSVKYNWIDGTYGGAAGTFKTKDNFWVEFQYLLY